MSVDIMKIPLRPFNRDAYSIEAMTGSKSVSQVVKLNLIMRFYKHVLGDMVDFSGIQNDSMEEAYYRTIKILMDSMPKWSSFQMEEIATKIIFFRLAMQRPDITGSLRKELFESLYDLLPLMLSPQQCELFHTMPMAVMDSLNREFPWKAIYVYSYRVANYLDFVDENKQLITNQFKDEHKRLMSALTVAEELLCPSHVPIYSAKEQYVCFSVGLGADGYYGVTENDWNLNFFIAAYVIEKLLDLANEYFHFEEDENDV